MDLIKLVRSCHGKSAWATYSGVGFKLDVYIRHTIPCSIQYGKLNIVCYLKPTVCNNNIKKNRKEFSDYISFINYRNELKTAFK